MTYGHSGPWMEIIGFHVSVNLTRKTHLCAKGLDCVSVLWGLGDLRMCVLKTQETTMILGISRGPSFPFASLKSFALVIIQASCKSYGHKGVTLTKGSQAIGKKIKVPQGTTTRPLSSSPSRPVEQHEARALSEVAEPR